MNETVAGAHDDDIVIFRYIMSKMKRNIILKQYIYEVRYRTRRIYRIHCDDEYLVNLVTEENSFVAENRYIYINL